MMRGNPDYQFSSAELQLVMSEPSMAKLLQCLVFVNE